MCVRPCIRTASGGHTNEKPNSKSSKQGGELIPTTIQMLVLFGEWRVILIYVPANMAVDLRAISDCHLTKKYGCFFKEKHVC